jgi:hypothetical protein
MTSIRRALAYLFAVSLCIGNVSCSSERAAQGVYEGIQNRNEILKTPTEKMSSPTPPTYPEYQEEKKRLEEKKND